MTRTTILGAMALSAILQTPVFAACAKDQVHTPGIIEIRAGMINNPDVRRSQVRFSDETRGTVVAVSNPDGSINWPSSQREQLGGEDAPELIYVQMFDGVFAIDPFQPLPEANDGTAQMLFRGTTLETDRTQHGRQYIERTKELFEKLEITRREWLRTNGYSGVRVMTNPNPRSEEDAQAKGLPEPSAVFERPADVPRGKSREQVNSGQTGRMSGVVAMLKSDEEPMRISLPHNVSAELASRVARMNAQSEAQAAPEEVAITDDSQ